MGGHMQEISFLAEIQKIFKKKSIRLQRCFFLKNIE